MPEESILQAEFGLATGRQAEHALHVSSRDPVCLGDEEEEQDSTEPAETAGEGKGSVLLPLAHSVTLNKWLPASRPQVPHLPPG